MKQAMIEICAGSYEDALAAYRNGAKRVELNSALALGGLTPTLASLILTKQNTDLKVICMDRPRGAGFCYTDVEVEVMFADAKLMLDNGADGIAFGFLNPDSTVNVELTKKMVDFIHSYGDREAVFHRAFDTVSDYQTAMEQLLACNVDRVLTSGLQAKAMQGKDLIKTLQDKYGDRIELLAGSGMNDTNAKEMMEYTGINQVHSSCKAWVKDPTTIGQYVNYTYGSDGHESDYDVVDGSKVKLIVESVL